MAQKYNEFINETDSEIKINDRVICHGVLGNNINLEGQTGIVTRVINYRIGLYTIFFDNMFSPHLTVEDNKVKSSLSILRNYFEKVETPPSNNPLTIFSENIFKVLEFCEYMDYPYKLDINYIDISDDSNYVTYLPLNRLNKLNGDDPFENKYREKLAIGKLLKKMNPYTDKINLDKKINIYKAMYDSIISDINKMLMVQGEDIQKWYQEKNYVVGFGTLNKSCMKNHYDKLSLYNDPSRVAMLIMVTPDNKLLGRALVWNVTEPNITYMDRVYTVYQEHEEKFYIFARENGWYNYRDDYDTSMIIRYNHDIGDEYQNPYMDTFKVFASYENSYYLTNDYPDCGDYIELEETNYERDDDDYDYYDDDY